MPLPMIVLASSSGQTWSSPAHLRLGRLADLEVTIDDPSISRLHAEVYLADEGWVIRDRGSSNGTEVNGVRIGRSPVKLREDDSIRLGTFSLRVKALQERPASIRVGGRSVHVGASTGWFSDETPMPDSPNDPVRLLRAALRVAHAHHSDLALQGVLSEVARVLAARRCGLFLIEDGSGQLTLKGLTTNGPGVIRPPSKTLAAASLRRRQSLLFQDATEAVSLQSESAVRGDLGSAVCAILHTPDREIGVLHLDRARGSDPFTEADLRLADTVAGALALSLDRQQLVNRHQTLLLQTVTALAQAVEMRDRYTGNHTHRVTTYSLLLAEALGLPADQRRQLQVATALHDIGKIAIDDNVLRKPDRLQPDELELMKSHVLRGAEIVQMIPGLEWALAVVRGHHERWDGNGYPDGLKGEGIPLTARIVAVVDAFDAMTSDRPYRPGMSVARAYAELRTGSGTHFDPTCVEAFVKLRPKIEELLLREQHERNQAAGTSETISRRELETQAGILTTPKPGNPTHD